MPKRVPTLAPPLAQVVRRARAREYDARPDRKADKAFYDSAAWLRFRAYILTRRPLCERCQEDGHLTPARHVHHVKPRKDRPDLAFDEDNVQALCVPCHNRVEHESIAAGH